MCQSSTMILFRPYFSWLLLLLPLLSLSLSAQPVDFARVGLFPDDTQLELSADVLSYSHDANLAMARGNVKVDYGTLHLSADEVTINQSSLDFTASGHIVLTADGLGRWEGTGVQGNIGTQSFAFGPFRIDGEVWHAGGESAKGTVEGDQELEGAWLSTCDCPEPHYAIHARRIVHHQDQTFHARHVFLEFGGIPVFYLPFLWGSTNANGAGWFIRPGYSGKKGAYLRLGRAWKTADAGKTIVYGDAMSKRGLGLGAEGEYRLADGAFRDAQLSFLGYALHDRRPPGHDDGYDRRFRSRADRYRLQFYGRMPLDETLTLRVHADVLSDLSMLEDWFKHDYRNSYQPKSFASLDYNNRFISLDVNVRPRVNSFYTVVENLPEITLTVPTIRVAADMPVTYTSRTTAGRYRMRWRDFSRSRLFFYPERIRDWLDGLDDAEREGCLDDPADYSAWRMDTLHTAALPLELFDGLKFTPRASIRLTAYSDSSRRTLSTGDLASLYEVDNPDATLSLSPARQYDREGGSRLRVASELGAELRGRLYSDWAAWQPSDLLEIDGARHVVEPYLNYTFAPSPSVDRDHLYLFDETDRLERQHFLRFGLDQHWQTHTAEQTRILASLQTYYDLHFERGEESDSHCGDLGSRLLLTPRRDLAIWGGVLHDVGEGRLQRGEAGFRAGREDRLNLRFFYIYRHGHLSRSVFSMGSDLMDFTGESGYLKKHFETADTATAALHLPFNDLTWADCEWEYDFDRCRMSEHSYVLTRVLHCWLMQLGVGWDNDKFKAMVLFRLTAFPNIKIDLGF